MTASKTQSASSSCAQSSSKLPGLDEVHVLAQVQRGRLQLLEARDRLAGQRAAVVSLAQSLRDDVEEHHVDPRGDQVGGHLGPHGPRSQDHGLADVLSHGSPSLLIRRLE